MKKNATLTKIALIALSLVMLLCLASCGKEKTQVYSVKETLSDAEQSKADIGEKKEYFSLDITLPKNFKQKDPVKMLGNYSAYFDSNNAKILVICNDLEEEDTTTALEKANALVAGLGSDAYTPTESADGTMAYYRYNTKLFGAKLSGICFVIRQGDNMWMVDMICKVDNFEELSSQFMSWSQTITFSEHPIQEYVID